MTRKSGGKDSMNEDISSIPREFKSCFMRIFSSPDICVPIADLLMSVASYNSYAWIIHAWVNY
jgi:hypothetical protein